MNKNEPKDGLEVHPFGFYFIDKNMGMVGNMDMADNKGTVDNNT